MRERMFDTIEQRHAHDLRNGDDGKTFYEDLLSAIRDSGDAQAAQEFESRFLPLLDPDKPSREAEIDALLLATPDLPRGYYMEEPNPHAPRTFLLIRGKIGEPAAEIRSGSWAGITAICERSMKSLKPAHR